MTRQEIAKLLKELGKPGENREEKLKAVKELKTKNFQGYDISHTLNSYKEY